MSDCFCFGSQVGRQTVLHGLKLACGERLIDVRTCFSSRNVFEKIRLFPHQKEESTESVVKAYVKYIAYRKG